MDVLASQIQKQILKFVFDGVHVERTVRANPVANAELELARGAGGCFDFNAVTSLCLNLLSKNPQTRQLAWVLEEARRNYVPPAPGHPPPADRESFRHSTTMVDKVGQRMRNIEKKKCGDGGKGRAGPKFARFS